VKHPKFLAAALALFVLGALAHAAPPAQDARGQAGGSGLEETLSRLGKILTRYGSKSAGGAIKTFDVKDFRGCKITYELTPRVGSDHQGYVPPIERVTIDLAALDPALVKVREGRAGLASVSFAAADGVPAVETSSGREPHHFGAASRSSSGYIALRNRGAAEEAREALTRAVELCQR
jgi:hypothetical protein